MKSLTHGSLFSGIGGFELGAQWCGIETLWNCEIERFQGKILKKHFLKAMHYEDIRKLQSPEYVDIISGGFPCQDVSIAGKGIGIKGDRSGLYIEMFRIIREIRPKYVLIENSPMLLIRGFEQILCNLSKIGYNAEWQCLSGTDFGIQQGRERLYCIAYNREIICKRGIKESIFRKPYLSGESARVYPGWRTRRDIPSPRTIRKANDIPNSLDRIRSLGNAVQPLVAKYLFECIKNTDNSINYQI
ncbi:DNA (cytosine-5-)-methyltransferase [uncultured Bacteroides sp.]|uniref:DNA cytosine methyltransferase n=1 Tax=uncultured Bacteroides sp. TaxID=162156 RepID=UPI002AA7FE70|nr:DNA (cytosine-5-)-methyltransferase [uncultured Bacteroides sp.]